MNGLLVIIRSIKIRTNASSINCHSTRCIFDEVSFDKIKYYFDKFYNTITSFSNNFMPANIITVIKFEKEILMDHL